MREQFRQEIGKIDFGRLIWLDEAGMNSNECYEYGYSLKGLRLYSKKTGKRGQRKSMIGAIRNNKLIAAMVYEGYGNASMFESWVESCLVPVLQPGQIVIMDNVSFHYSVKAREMIEGAGCEIKFLPPYSPDLNPIEHHWHKIKNTVRKLLNLNIDLFEAIMSVLKNCLSI